MNESAQVLLGLLSLEQNLSLNRRDLIIEGILAGRFIVELHTGRVPSKNLLSIYKVRAQHLKRFSTSHAKRLQQEVVDFCAKLESTPEDEVQIWTAYGDRSEDQNLFVGVQSKKVLGCLTTVSSDSVTETEWQLLWGKKSEIIECLE